MNYCVAIGFTVLLTVFAIVSASVPPSLTEIIDEAEYRNVKRPISRDDPICNQTALDPNTATFFRHFGFSDGAFPANRTMFENAMYDYLNVQGVNGWNDIQGWWNDYLFSTGALNFQACTNWQVIQANFNMSTYDAKNWNALFLTFEYDLGVGFNVLFTNWYCMLGVANHLAPTVTQCRTLFTHQQEQHPELLCQNIADYLQCIQRPYAQYCGIDASSLICYDERINFQLFYPECNAAGIMSCEGHPKWLRQW